MKQLPKSIAGDFVEPNQVNIGTVQGCATWSLKEAAKFLGVCGRTVRRMADAGQLPEGAVVTLRRRRLFNVTVLTSWFVAGCPAATGSAGAKTKSVATGYAWAVNLQELLQTMEKGQKDRPQ